MTTTLLTDDRNFPGDETTNFDETNRDFPGDETTNFDETERTFPGEDGTDFDLKSDVTTEIAEVTTAMRDAVSVGYVGVVSIWFGIGVLLAWLVYKD